MIFLGHFSLSCYHDNYFRYFMFGKYNGFVSKARVSACMYFLVVFIIFILKSMVLRASSVLINTRWNLVGNINKDGISPTPHINSPIDKFLLISHPILIQSDPKFNRFVLGLVLVAHTHFRIYYIHFEINGVSCYLIGSQECDFSTNRTPSSAIRTEIAPSFNQSH